ncbi:hypothetical protein [Mucilaginibacter panaciglaebae]|uniref:Zinc finger protein n=1 Tax=Mucilaginibacter panaciglaebae TaxID=502331 RepID=A0ABP7WMM4_9SPHI
MSSIEEKLWEYIDGTCTPAEREAIDQLITCDEHYRHKYQELLAFNQEMATDMELDEPPMAFTYHVMETVRTEYATQHPLKTRVNKSLIGVIGGFFIVSIIAMLVLVLASLDWSAGGQFASNSTHLPDFKNLIGGTTLKIFLFFDTILLLYLADRLLHNGILHKQA